MVDRQKVASLVFEILEMIYVEHQKCFRRKAIRCRATVEQMAAAAIASAIEELLLADRAELN